MKLTVKAADLKKALDEPVKITKGASHLNVLAHVQLSLRGERLAVYATNYDTTLRVDVPLVGDVEDGELVLNAVALHKIAKLQPKGSEITIQSTGDKGRDALVTRGKFSATLDGLAAMDFPDAVTGFAPKVAGSAWRVTEEALLDALNLGTYCMSTDESRMNLNGSLLKIEPDVGSASMTWVAVDGYRLAMTERRIASRQGAAPVEGIVHREAVDSLKRVLKGFGGALSIWEGKAGVVFALSSGTALCARTIEDQFPEYERVVPRRNPDPGVVDRKGMIEAAQRLGQLCGTPRRMGIVLDAKCGELRLSFGELDGVAAFEALSMLGQTEHDLSDCVVNWRYLVDALKRIDTDEVLLGYTDHLSPIRLESCDGKHHDVHVIMPMREN